MGMAKALTLAVVSLGYSLSYAIAGSVSISKPYSFHGSPEPSCRIRTMGPTLSLLL